MPSDHHSKTLSQGKKLTPHRQLGQNFLVHRATAEKIIRLAGVTADDMILELGVGFGALTRPLALAARRVIGLELDSGIIAWHAEHQDLPANVTLRHQDLLKTDFHAIADETGTRLKILANLPYSVSNPLLFKLIDHREIMEWAVLMLQKEVADRLTAPIGTKEYGILSILLAACASVETLMKVGPGQFHPRPKVDSTVVRIRFYPRPARAGILPAHDPGLLRLIVRGAFQQRRKNLQNSLTNTIDLGLTKEQTGLILGAAGIPTTTRPEQLSLEEFVRLTNCCTAFKHHRAV